jgi:hypothetical protein
MQSSPRSVSVTLALALTLLSFASGALADPKSDVAAVTSAWEQAFGGDDPEKVLALYADDDALWGTLSPTVRSAGKVCEQTPHVC